jgi:Carboxypeptidase regulatory-like domain
MAFPAQKSSIQSNRLRANVLARCLRLLLQRQASCWFMLVLLLCAGARAQEVNGSISGTVTDSANAVVGDVAITATNQGTGAVATTTSDAVGKYIFTSLPSGTYQLSTERTGFSSAVISGLTLTVYQKATVDIVLHVGSAGETVTVTETTPLVDTTSASIGTVVGEEAIRDLPLNLRQVGALALTVPGTVDTTGRSLTSATGNGSGFNDSSYSGTGGGSAGNLLVIDGMISRSLNNGSFALNPVPEMVKEFRIQYNVYDASFGLASGSIMNLITESGTNKIHGSGWEYLRNRVLDARNYFADAKPEFIRNQFGGAVGGPIIENKLFYFGSYEGLRLVQGQTISSVVPTAAEQKGDFSSFLTGQQANLCASSGAAAPGNLNFDTGQIFDPKSEYLYTCPVNPNAAGSTTQVLVGTPIPGNIITNIDTTAQKVLALYPAPNSDGATNYINQNPFRRQDDIVDARIDWTISSRDTVFGRYLLGNTNQKYPGDFSPFNSQQHYRGHNGAAGWTHVFGPTLINDLRGGYQNDYLTYTCQNCPRAQGTLASFGIAGLAANTPGVELYPNFIFSNFATFGDGFPGYYPDVLPDSLERVSDTVTKSLGRHTLLFGADLNFWQTDGVEDPVQLNGAINFNGQYSSLGGEIPNISTASDLADLELGYPSGGLYTQNPIVTRLVGGQWLSFFGQDNIRVNSRLSIEAGLRWEYRKQPVDKDNQIAAFYPSAKTYQPGDATLITPLGSAANDALCSQAYFQSASGSCLIMTSSERRQVGLTGNKVRQLSFGPGAGDFAPRFGVSWKATERTVVHAGGGLFYNLPLTNIMGSYANNNPVFTRTPVYTTAFGAPPPLTNGASTTTETMFSSATPLSLSQISSQLMPSPFYHTPTVYGWSMSVQSELQQNLALEVAYLGNRGDHLDHIHLVGNQSKPGVGDLQARRPWPDFNTLTYDSYDAYSSYNALSVKLTKRSSHGLSGLVAYTFAKELNNNGGDADHTSLAQDDNNPAADYAVSDTNIRHRLVVSGVYELPFGEGRAFLNHGGVVNAFAGGWDVASIITAQSGFPFTATTTQDYSNTGSPSPRPDRLCSTEPRKITAWFDTNCFTTAALAQDLADGTPRFGNSGRNILSGPRLVDADLSLIKRFVVEDKLTTEFRAEFFNMFNHPNFSTPNATIGGSTAGQITSAGSPRDIQFGLKVKF